MISVLIVDDSPLVIGILKATLHSDPKIQVVGTAQNGRAAMTMTRILKPDVITMDMHMPQGNGLEAIKHIMSEIPTPILIVSTSVHLKGMGVVFEALTRYGALDAVNKDLLLSGDTTKTESHELIEKVKALSKICVTQPSLEPIEKIISKIHVPPFVPSKKRARKAIGIVASTGGPVVIGAILSILPPSFSIPIVIVQHLTSGFTHGFADWLHHTSGLSVVVPRHEETLAQGTVYIAPTGVHIEIDSHHRVILSDSPPILYQKPSGSLMLASLAKCFGASCMGITLTGIGADGATGMKAIYDADGYTVVQDEHSSVIFSMPQSVIELNAAHDILSIDGIAKSILTWSQGIS